MQKLVITKEELNCHKKYFYENAVEELKRMKEKYKKRAFTPKGQLKLLSLCLYYKKQLAIGKPYQLRKIQKIIDQKYAEVLKKDEVFKKDVERAFGYDKFSCADIGVNILQKAKKNSRKSPKSNYNNKMILEELYKELENYDKGVADEVRLKIEKQSDKITREKLEGIISETLLVYIIDRDMPISRLTEWNPYIMLFHRKLRTCPYCNRQYITPVYSETGKVRADLDHFYPKSQYPYFSMSIYNLVPSCKFCNSSLKGVKEFSFEDKSPYEISIDDLAVFKYLPACKINFYGKSSIIKTYKEMFKIEELYKFHENIAEDLLEKTNKYSLKRISDMIDSGLVSEKELYKLIVGKISTKEKILEEPLNKFKRDMIKDIFGERILELVEN